MDDAVVVGIDSLEGEPGFVAIEAAVQQLGEGAEGELAVIHGLAVDPDLPTHEGLALRGKGCGIGQVVLLIGVGGDHVAAADDVLVLVHELEVDDTVVVGKDGLEGQPGLILVEVLAVLLHECIERIVGELALIHGGIPKTHLPAHKGLALGGEAGGSRGLKLDAGGGGDDIAAAQGHVLAVHIVHKGHMDGVVHSALTVQADHEGIRDNPLDVVVIQHNGHGGAVHTGVSLRIGVIRRHIGGGIELDVVVITLDAQTVARHRVAAIQQAGGDGLVALGGAVHLQVPQKGLQLGIRGGDSADGDRDNIVINHQVALFRQLITLGDPAGINVGGAHVVGVGSHSHGVAVADCLTGCLVHEADRDVSRDALEDRGDGNEALGPIPDDMLKHIGQSRGRRQYAAVLTVVAPAGEGVAGRGGDALKGVETGFRLGEGFMIEHLTGGLGQISLGGIRNVVVDGDGAVLLDEYCDFLCSGSDNVRVRIRVGQNIALGKRQPAQRELRVTGGGDCHARSAATAIHIFTGALVHKFDGNLTGVGDNLGDKRDVFASALFDELGKACIVELSVIELSVVKCKLPAHELHPAGNSRSRRSNFLSGIGGGNCEVSGINLSPSVALIEAQIKGIHLGLGPGTGDHNISVVDLALARISPAAESIGVALRVLHLVASAIRGIHRILVAGLQAGHFGGKLSLIRRFPIPFVGDLVALRVVRLVIAIAIYRPHGIEGSIPVNGKLSARIGHLGLRVVGVDHVGLRLAPAHEDAAILGHIIDAYHLVRTAGLDLIAGHGARPQSPSVGVILHGIGDRNHSACDVVVSLLTILGIRVGDTGRRVGRNIGPRRAFLGYHGEGDGLRLLGNGFYMPSYGLTLNRHIGTFLNREPISHHIGKGDISAGGQLILRDLVSNLLNQRGELRVDAVQIREIVGIADFFFRVIGGRKLTHEFFSISLQAKADGIDLCALGFQSIRLIPAIRPAGVGLAIRDKDDISVLFAVPKILLGFAQAFIVVGSGTDPRRIHLVDRAVQLRYAVCVQGGQAGGSIRHNITLEGHNTDFIIWIGLSKRVHQGLSRALGGAHFGDFSSAVLVARIRPIIHFTAGIAGPIVAKPSIVLCVARRGALSGSIQHAGGVIHHHHHIESIGGCGGSLYVLSADVQRNLHISGLFIVLSGLPCLDFARLKLFCSGRRRLRRKGGGGQECQHHGEDQEC